MINVNIECTFTVVVCVPASRPVHNYVQVSLQFFSDTFKEMDETIYLLPSEWAD